MDPTKILSLLEQLDDDIDDIEDAVAPFIQKTIPEFASKLPLLDKAKLYTLVTYAIESILFSYLRLNGVNAREHPVFTELTRMKQYFEKIKLTENPPAAVASERNLRLDKGAAGRFIKAGLSGNDKYDLQRAEQMAKERAKSHIRFEEISKKRKGDGETTAPNSAKLKTSDESDDSNSSSDSSDESAPVAHKSKKSKTAKAAASAESMEDSSSTPNSKSKKSKRRAQEKKSKSKPKKVKTKGKK
ncbi:5648379c-d8c7-4fbd-99d9-3e6a89088f9e [Sclerotinia trifoliorum]|uniref:Exosome complex protein n=1 Tax=Sclerotinia trifoliorum TaxID=28548 RepID=A0A8H2W166_9HELO|nr:5648379c-d8c7-4fbd-99d9-3e6a89088f9e [Sclerotinia trifoliorum]